jgi:serine protease Do
VTLVPGPSLRKGQFVLAFGNPYAIARDGSASVSWGLVANRARRMAPAAATIDEDFLKQETIHHYGTLLQIDARLNLGTSGGPVFDLQGRFAGITLATAALEGYEKSAGHAIPFDDATLRIVQDLAQGHEVEYGFLGIEPRYLPPTELQRFSGTFRQPSAALVFQVYQNSPAAVGTESTKGLEAGDVVLDVGGVPVLDQMDLMREVALLGPGATARLRVWRERQKRETIVEAILGKWPVRDDEGIVATRPRFAPWNGLTVDYPTARRKFVTFPFQYRQAVVVMRSESQAEWSRDVVPGSFVTHVNGKSVATPAAFHEEVKKAKGKVRLQLENRAEPIEVPVP